MPARRATAFAAPARIEEIATMPRTLTATYSDTAAARNAQEDLIASGIPSEKVFLERDTPDLPRVKVITPAETERELREILGRHDPVEITASDL